MLLSEFINLKEKPGCNMTEEGRGCAVHGMNECPGYKMIETSAQEKLHQQHQEIRKKSGLPNPNYYKELRATFDLSDEERQAAVAAIKKKYKIKEQNVAGVSAGDNAAYANYADTRAKGDLLGKEMDPSRETGIKTITSPEYKSAVSNMTTGLAAQNPEMEKRYQMNKLTAPKPTYGASAAQLESEDLEEAGPFSYGAKKPRKGSVADLAAKKRKEQERNKQPVEPKDHMVGVARVVKDVAEAMSRRDFLKGMGAAALASAAGSAKADWEKPITTVDKMTDKKEILWYNISDDGKAYLSIFDYGEGFVNASISLINDKLSIPPNAQVWIDPTTKKTYSRNDQNYIPGRLRIDNGPILNILFGGGANQALIMSDSLSGIELSRIIAGAKNQIRLDVSRISNLNILTFNAKRKNFEDINIQGVAEGSGITKLNDYNQWSDQVDAQGAEKHMQKNRTLIVAQSWDGEKVGEFDTRSNQGWIMTQGISEGAGEKLLSKMIPGGASAFNALDAVRRYKSGDKVGAGIAAAGTIPITSIPAAAVDMARDKYYTGSFLPSDEQRDLANLNRQVADMEKQQWTKMPDGSERSPDGRTIRGPITKAPNEVTNEGIEQYLEELSRAGYEVITETAELCPECGGPAFADQLLAEKKDACYSKVKSRYKVWPSAYASGALVRCRKVGAKNWGNKSKK